MGKVKSALGQMVDFDLMKIQANIAQQNTINRTHNTSPTYLTNPLLDTPTDVVESIPAVEIYKQVHGTPVTPVVPPITNPINDPVATPPVTKTIQPAPLNIATPSSKESPKEVSKEPVNEAVEPDDKNKKAKS